MAVCQKALQDAEAVTDSVWAVQLQQVLAHAQAAQGDVAAALNTQRAAMTRWGQAAPAAGELGSD